VQRARSSRTLRASLAAALAFALACAAAQAPASRFRGDLSGLERAADSKYRFRRGELHRRPGVDLRSYRALQVSPVELAPDLDTDDHRYLPRELAWLQRRLDRALRRALEAELQLVDAPGEGVLQLRFLLTAVRANALPLGRDPARGSGARGYDQSLGVGRAAMQLELRDSQSGELLLALVDRYQGEELAHNPRAHESWGDAEYAVRRWASWLRRELAPAEAQPPGS